MTLSMDQRESVNNLDMMQRNKIKFEIKEPKGLTVFRYFFALV